MKTCTKCKIEKQLSDFSKCCAAKDGLQYHCKRCQADYGQSHKVEKADYDRVYYQSPVGKESHHRSYLKCRKNNPDKRKARDAVNHAITAGKLIRPSTCESCKEKKFVEGHHKDYSKPLDVDWLCLKCHRELDEREQT